MIPESGDTMLAFVLDYFSLANQLVILLVKKSNYFNFIKHMLDSSASY